MENQAPEQFYYDDVRKSGYLRKQKSMHKRYFVLRGASERGPARLEYYENEKKFRAKAPVPKKALNLETCFNINKRADSKNKHLIVVYTREESFCIAAESEAEQEGWYEAMVKLQCKSKVHVESPEYGVVSETPGPAFKEVWQVKVWPKGLGQAKNLVGIYRLCLTEKTVNFVKLNSDAAAVVLQLLNVRRCGHSENFFFVEVGRSAVTGPGEFWMQVEDSVVAQNMHETLLEAMKSLSEEFRQRSKSQSCSTSSNPITVPSRRHHPNPPPSQVGFPRRSRTDTSSTSSNPSPTPAPKNSHPHAGDGPRTEGASPNGTCSSSATTTPAVRSVRPSVKTPLGLAKSTPSPAPGSACLSSSSTLGSECAYARELCAGGASAGGFPGDYGSSDEYDSSPGEHSQSRSLTPDILGGYHPLGEADYIAMGRQDGRGGGPANPPPSQPPRRVLRRSSSRESEAERRLQSKRASLPPMPLEKLTPGLPRRRVPQDLGAAGEEGEEDYAVMSRGASQRSFAPRVAGGSYLDLPGSQSQASEAQPTRDNGYMAMLPGVANGGQDERAAGQVVKPDDYMAMTPNSSVSPPHQINPLPSDGYMMMSPNGSCSPDQKGGTWGVHPLAGAGGSSVDSKAGSDYMNMSPVSCRSSCSTPPDVLLPDPPKMVYSYYSLPRSYKHAPPARFEGGAQTPPPAADNPGRSCVTGQSSSRLLSSSSSFSSSASSESLGEAEERPGRSFLGAAGNGNGQRRGGRGGQRSRPVSLFIDVSKASTLPRVRETPLPPEPKSPGEYVSIEFRGGASGDLGPSVRLLRRPPPCLTGYHDPLQQDPLGSEYVSMDLGPPLALPGNPTVEERRPVLSKPSPQAGPASEAASEPCLRALPPESPTFGDYTEMAFIAGSLTPKSASPKEEPAGGQASLGQVFPLPKLSPNPDQGAKVIRADSRRRHCSETFLQQHNPPPLVFADHPQVTKRLGFESVWGKGEAGSEPNPQSCLLLYPSAAAPPPPASVSMEQGLNYIDLDLASKELAHPALEGAASGQPAPPRLYSSPLSNGGAPSLAVNTYASIDFHKSEELRSHQSSGKDGTGETGMGLDSFVCETVFVNVLFVSPSPCCFE
ncbi:insulin receptor substrate 1-B-like [Acipenser oxyrinchus oxyrinchus]|uniref:Insulin receptor substrate 1-B-like n=1 Tax=Acipenser oxyrinchus oxyrinchus TaxID=40147 RepID=A0AAD8FUC5_ACIOX|nr:insulin receptor substrate 1-B-like [Acipenser oxyrinchus oxyrinchus]